MEWALYLKRDNYATSINRFRVVVEDFEPRLTPGATHRLVEAYLSLGLTDERKPQAHRGITRSTNGMKTAIDCDRPGARTQSTGQRLAGEHLSSNGQGQVAVTGAGT